MGTNLQQLLPENVAQALCRTLINSLWQGLMLAILTGLVMLFTRKSSAAKRYRWLVGLLYLFSITFLFTLVASLTSAPYIDPITPNNSAGPADLWELLNYNLLYIQNHAGIIVLIWLIVVCARSFKMLFGFYALERLKKTKVGRIAADWEQKVNVFAQTMGIKRAVSLLESAIIKVPVAIGYLKPLILIPVGMINALNAQEVEAILLHELAHIRRQDSLVNLLQNCMETIFFFNPAILWLSSLIRAEREHCCDDVAVSYTKNKVRYISALVHFEEYALSNPGLALALTGKKGGMLQRLERMAANRNRSLNKLEMAGLALLVLLSSVFIAARPGSEMASIASKAPTAISPEISITGGAITRIAPTPLTSEPWGEIFKKQKERAAQKRILEQQKAESAATTQIEPVPISPELRKYIHDRELAVATHQPGAVPLTPEFKKYILNREIAVANRLKAEKAALQRTRPTDSIPKK